MTDRTEWLAVALEAVEAAAIVAGAVQVGSRALALEKADKSPSPSPISGFRRLSRVTSRPSSATSCWWVRNLRGTRGSTRGSSGRPSRPYARCGRKRPRTPCSRRSIAALATHAARASGPSIRSTEPRASSAASSTACPSPGSSRRPVLGVLACPNLPLSLDKPFDPPDPQGSLYWAVAAKARSRAAGSKNPRAGTERRRDHVLRVGRGAHSDQAGNRRVVEALGMSEIRSVRIDSQCKYAVVARGQADAYLRLPTERRLRGEDLGPRGRLARRDRGRGHGRHDVHGRPLDFSTGRLPREEPRRGGGDALSPRAG